MLSSVDSCVGLGRRLITFSAIRAAILAFGRVVLIASWCSRAETRFLAYSSIPDSQFHYSDVPEHGFPMIQITTKLSKLFAVMHGVGVKVRRSGGVASCD